ncbi:MAG: hypothetical protein IJ374_04410 [Lachnospiraceae bacterium]|nr:hypothetical protein [Lachnospiraceae bacterium]
MSDYRRLISYIYEYEGKQKGKNVGFVKLEAKNGQCRLNLNVKRVYVGANAIGVYLLGKNGEKTFLGNLFVRNGNGEFRATVDAKNVEGTGNELDTYYGLTIHDVKHSWRSYTTVWEDAAAVPALFEEQEADVSAAAENDSEAGPFAQDVLPGSEEQELSQAVSSVVQEIEEEIARSAELGTGAGKETLSPVYSNPTETTVLEQTDVPVISPELENPEVLRYLQETEETVFDPEQLWQELRKTYPKIQPFDYDGGSEVLTIRPQDIGRLPRESWIYGNNSFLLHGYYNFRYLILIRLENGSGSPRYLIGVPGHYYSNEKYMATMFGFPNFVLSKKQPPNDGRFGYWYTDIKMR